MLLLMPWRLPRSSVSAPPPSSTPHALERQRGLPRRRAHGSPASGGRLGDLSGPPVAQFCSNAARAVSAAGDAPAPAAASALLPSPQARGPAAGRGALEHSLLEAVAARFRAVDAALRSRVLGRSCEAACAVRQRPTDSPALSDPSAAAALAAEGIAWWSLHSRTLAVTRPLVVRFLDRRCGCAKAADGGPGGREAAAAAAQQCHATAPSAPRAPLIRQPLAQPGDAGRRRGSSGRPPSAVAQGSAGDRVAPQAKAKAAASEAVAVAAVGPANGRGEGAERAEPRGRPL